MHTSSPWCIQNSSCLLWKGQRISEQHLVSTLNSPHKPFITEYRASLFVSSSSSSSLLHSEFSFLNLLPFISHLLPAVAYLHCHSGCGLPSFPAPLRQDRNLWCLSGRDPFSSSSPSPPILCLFISSLSFRGSLPSIALLLFCLYLISSLPQMDVGVGAFLFANALTSKQARGTAASVSEQVSHQQVLERDSVRVYVHIAR